MVKEKNGKSEKGIVKRAPFSTTRKSGYRLPFI